MRSTVVCLVVLASLAVFGCGGSSGPATGSERGPCYGNGTCNAGLVCLSNTCVKPATSGAAGTTGTAGAGGGAGTTGAGGAAGTGGSVGSAGSGGTSGTGTGGTAGAGGSAGTGGSGTGGAAGAGAGGTGGSVGGSGGAAAPNCTDYCAAITSACSGTSAQYTTLAECQAVCPSFPIGTAADSTGNTLGCRAHLLAATAPATPTSCAVAGPSGGNVCGNDLCAAYCTLMLAHCPNMPSSYASMQACMSACGSFPAGSGAYSSNVTSSGGANAYCYFAFAALTAVDPAIHCPHAVVGSITCQ